MEMRFYLLLIPQVFADLNIFKASIMDKEFLLHNTCNDFKESPKFYSNYLKYFTLALYRIMNLKWNVFN